MRSVPIPETITINKSDLLLCHFASAFLLAQGITATARQFVFNTHYFLNRHIPAVTVCVSRTTQDMPFYVDLCAFG